MPRHRTDRGGRFHAALGLDAAAFADVQARVRTRVLSTFVRRGLIDKDDATEMRAWAHDGGFSVDGSVRIEGADRTGLERLLRYCARPPFALEHPHQRESTQPPRIAPARGPPLWEAAAAEQAENDPQWDQAPQPGPEVEFDQRIAW